MTPLQEIKKRLKARQDRYLQRARECLQNGHDKFAVKNWAAFGLTGEALKVVVDVENGRPDTQN